MREARSTEPGPLKGVRLPCPSTALPSSGSGDEALPTLGDAAVSSRR